MIKFSAMKTLALCLLLAAPVFAQEVEYDKFKDRTLVYHRDGFINARKGTTPPVYAVQLTTWFEFAGAKLDKPPEAFLIRFQARVYRAWAFLHDSRLIFLADGERIALGSGTRSSSMAVETVTYEVDRETLTKIVNAAKVEMQLGSFEAEVSEKQRAGIKKVLDYKP